jgi:hypothetical protein
MHDAILAYLDESAKDVAGRPLKARGDLVV